MKRFDANQEHTACLERIRKNFIKFLIEEHKIQVKEVERNFDFFNKKIV